MIISILALFDFKCIAHILYANMLDERIMKSLNAFKKIRVPFFVLSIEIFWNLSFYKIGLIDNNDS